MIKKLLPFILVLITSCAQPAEDIILEDGSSLDRRLGAAITPPTPVRVVASVAPPDGFRYRVTLLIWVTTSKWTLAKIDAQLLHAANLCAVHNTELYAGWKRVPNGAYAFRDESGGMTKWGPVATQPGVISPINVRFVDTLFGRSHGAPAYSSTQTLGVAVGPTYTDKALAHTLSHALGAGGHPSALYRGGYNCFGPQADIEEIYRLIAQKVPEASWLCNWSTVVAVRGEVLPVATTQPNP